MDNLRQYIELFLGSSMLIAVWVIVPFIFWAGKREEEEEIPSSLRASMIWAIIFLLCWIVPFVYVGIEERKEAEEKRFAYKKPLPVYQDPYIITQKALWR